MKGYFKAVLEYQKRGLNNLWYRLRNDFINDFVVEPYKDIGLYRHVFKVFPLLILLYSSIVVILSPILLPVMFVVILLIIAPLQAADINIYH